MESISKSFTQCQEQIEGYQILVGGFTSFGLRVTSDLIVEVIGGVAPQRKLF